MRTATRHLRQRAASDDGAQLVEFALVFVLFMVILWGIISYGFVFALKQSLTHAATEAGRQSISSGNAEADAVLVATEELRWLGDKATHMTVTATTGPCDLDQARECLTVVTSYPWKAQPVIPALFGIPTPDVLTSESTIQLG